MRTFLTSVYLKAFFSRLAPKINAHLLSRRMAAKRKAQPELTLAERIEISSKLASCRSQTSPAQRLAELSYLKRKRGEKSAAASATNPSAPSEALASEEAVEGAPYEALSSSIIVFFCVEGSR